MSLPQPHAAALLLDAPPAKVDSDLLVIPVFEDEGLGRLAPIEAAVGGELRRARESGELGAKIYERFVCPVVDRSWRARRVLFIGAGERTAWTVPRLRHLATAAGLDARQRRIGRVAFLLRHRIDPPVDVQAIVEGFALAEFDAARYKTGDRETGTLESVQVVLSDRPDAAAQGAFERGRILGACSNLARELANEPGNMLGPQHLAERAADLHAEGGAEVEILDERAIADLKMGLLLGVSQGSAQPPRLIVMRYQPPDAAGPVLGLIGKGITFDTGGISIKPAEGLERMKDDMAGGAAVICAMRAIAALKPPIKVLGLVPAAENMPGARALRPGDVLVAANGKTVEVINTDAEGRLILGDALWYAGQQGATHLVDVATLTGACMVALGRITTGLFGTPDSWVEIVRRTADRAGDRSWPMPLFDEYFDQLRSDIADMINSGGRPAGAITAALFLKQFTGNLPWAHLDIAGTAWAEDAQPYQPKGPTGVAVRTLAELSFTSESWSAEKAGTRAR